MIAHNPVKSAACSGASGSGPYWFGPDGAAAKAEFDEQDEPEHRERHRDDDRQQARLIVGAGHFEHREQVEQRAGAEERDQQPERQVAVMGALRGEANSG